MATAADRIDEDLGSGEWLVEADHDRADIAVFPHAAHFEGLGTATAGSVQRWIERVAARPSPRPALAASGIQPAPSVMARKGGGGGSSSY